MALDLINNVALLLAICWLQSLVSSYCRKGSGKAQFLSGLVFGGATVIVMLTSILIVPGLWLWTDSGTVVVGVSSMLYGPISGGMAFIAGMAYKMWMGGAASTGAVVSLAVSYATGILIWLLRQRIQFQLRTIHFLLFGLGIHAIGTWQLYRFHIPIEIVNSAEFYLTLITVMTAATVILGLQLKYIERKTALEKKIRENEKRLSLIAKSIPDQLILANRKGEVTDVFTPERVVNLVKSAGNHLLEKLAPDAFSKHYSFLISRALSAAQPERDTYSCKQNYLLDTESAEDEHHFESVSTRVKGSEEDDEVIILTRDITSRVNAEKKVRYLAYNDPLTDLPNSYKAVEEVKERIRKFGELRQKFNVTMLRLSNFYLFNESLGKEAGDLILKKVADRFREQLTSNDFVARYSGIEFFLISPGDGELEGLVDLFRKLRLDVTIPLNAEEFDVNIEYVAGVARFPRDGSDYQELIRRASLALESAKKSNTKVRIYDRTLDHDLDELLNLRSYLVNAIKDDRLELYYRPVIALQSNNVSALEILVGCEDDLFGLDQPGFFLRAAEESGLILPLAAWVLENACFSAKKLEEKSGFNGKLIVHISALELIDPEFPHLVASVINRTGFDPRRLCFQLTSLKSVSSVAKIYSSARHLEDIGATIYFDILSPSFGVLKLTKELQHPAFLISKDYLQELASDEESLEAFRYILDFSRIKNINTRVEGVDDQKLQDLVKKIGVDNVQGECFSKAVKFEELEAFLTKDMN